MLLLLALNYIILITYMYMYIDVPSSAENIANLVSIPVAPPPTLVNPDKPVAMASAPTHVNSTSALTKQKLLQTIQMKEQQKFLEQAISHQLGGGMTSSELLAQALKNISPVSALLVPTLANRKPRRVIASRLGDLIEISSTGRAHTCTYEFGAPTCIQNPSRLVKSYKVNPSQGYFQGE